jgi:hypothetical protein
MILKICSGIDQCKFFLVAAALVVWVMGCSGEVGAVDAGLPTTGGSGGGSAGGEGMGTGGGAPSGGGATTTGGGGPTGGGSSGDAGMHGDAGAECPADALFCEGFEGSALDLTKWKVNGMAQTFTIDSTTPAHQGRSSLHMAFGAAYGHTGHQTVEIQAPLPAPDDRIYVRAYLRFGNLGLPGQHPFFIDVADSAGVELGFGSIINDFALLAYAPNGLDNPRIWYEGGGGYHSGIENGDQTPTSENGLMAQTWICVEMMFFGDHQGPGDTAHPDEEVKVWLNGTLIPQLGATDALWRAELQGRAPPEHWSPVYAQARWRFGVESFGPVSASLDLWFDGIVLASSRIGCQ